MTWIFTNFRGTKYTDRKNGPVSNSDMHLLLSDVFNEKRAKCTSILGFKRHISQRQMFPPIHHWSHVKKPFNEWMLATIAHWLACSKSVKSPIFTLWYLMSPFPAQVASREKHRNFIVAFDQNVPIWGRGKLLRCRKVASFPAFPSLKRCIIGWLMAQVLLSIKTGSSALHCDARFA